MKLVKQILFMFFLTAGLSLSVMGQKGGDQKKPPPKGGNPPVINPGQKPPRENPPREEKKPKRPGMAFALRPGVRSADLA
jgi:hypothetical protein